MNKLTAFFLIFAIALLLIGCAKTEQTTREIEEVAVYSLLLKDECRSYYEDLPVLILNQTYYESGFEAESILAVEPSLNQQALDDYQEVNQDEQTLDPALFSTYEFCEFISGNEIEAAAKENSNWFNDHMVIRFTRIGFNDNFDQAIVAREYSCGGECAGNDLYILVRTNNIWIIKAVVQGYRS